MSKYERVIGIDVSSRKLDVSDSMGKLPALIEYSPEAIAKFIKKLDKPEQTLVVCESSGGWENVLVDMLHAAKVNVAVVNALRLYHYARGNGHFEKSDKIDAKVICHFGQHVELHLTKPRTQAQKQHQATLRRRTQVLTMINQEKNRTILCEDKETLELIGKVIKTLKDQLKMINKKLAEFNAALAQEDPRVEIIASIPGVGPVTTATLIIELPELGNIPRGNIAKLVGVAPMIKQSGQSDAKRKVRGGRTTVRRALYMAALAATKHNPVIAKFYKRLLQRGKPKKVALVACMRKLLLIIHDMVRNGTKWDPAWKARDQDVSNLATRSTCSMSV